MLQQHFRGRYVLWEGGFPAPRVVNRGGTLTSGGCGLWSGVRLEVAKNAHLSIGKGTYLNRSTTVVCHERVQIGDRCKISWDVVITDSDEHALPGQRTVTAPVVIEDDVWIGFRVLVLKGVTIGKGAVVAAGAIVTKDVPAHSLVVGQPARVVRAWCPERAGRADGASGGGSMHDES